jgi:hypothetical protein
MARVDGFSLAGEGRNQVDESRHICSVSRGYRARRRDVVQSRDKKVLEAVKHRRIPEAARSNGPNCKHEKDCGRHDAAQRLSSTFGAICDRQPCQPSSFSWSSLDTGSNHAALTE